MINLKVYLDYSQKSLITLESLIECLKKQKQVYVGIVGLEVLPYIPSDCDIFFIPSIQIKFEDYSLLLYAMNQTGYENIMLLTHLKVINKEILLKHKEGTLLIASNYHKVFDEWGDDFYLEINSNRNYIEQNVKNFKTNKQLIYLNDIHYIQEYESRHYGYKYGYDVNEAWFKDDVDLQNSFDKYCLNIPYNTLLKSMENTYEFVKKCKPIKFIKTFEKQELYPVYPIKDKKYFLKKLVFQKFRKLEVSNRELYEKRLEYEMELYDSKNLIDYLLIIYDLVKNFKACYNLRGSAVASLVLYVLGISVVDPLKYNLMFERFLNDKRNEPPDIDLEIEHEKRDEVIAYLREKYTTVYEMGVFSKWGKNNIKYKDVIHHISKHPTGVVICSKSLERILPMVTNMDEKKIIGWDDKTIGKIGLIKFDIISLTILSHIRKIFEEKGLSYNDIDFEDARVYKAFSKGKIGDVFQFDSFSGKSILETVKPTCFNDIVACCALNRPMALQAKFHEKYALFKSGQEKPRYLHKKLIPILQSTYSLPIYQDQIMEIVSVITTQSLAEADEFRKIISHKNEFDSKALDEIRFRFIKMAKDNDVSAQIASKILEYIELYQEVSFNKSHSVSYARLAFISMWLKIYHSHSFEESLK